MEERIELTREEFLSKKDDKEYKSSFLEFGLLTLRDEMKKF